MVWIAVAILGGISWCNASRYSGYCENIEKAVEKIVGDLRYDWNRERVASAAKASQEYVHTKKIAALEERISDLEALVEKLQASAEERSRKASQAAIKQLLGGG